MISDTAEDGNDCGPISRSAAILCASYRPNYTAVQTILVRRGFTARVLHGSTRRGLRVTFSALDRETWSSRQPGRPPALRPARPDPRRALRAHRRRHLCRLRPLPGPLRPGRPGAAPGPASGAPARPGRYSGASRLLARARPCVSACRPAAAGATAGPSSDRLSHSMARRVAAGSSRSCAPSSRPAAQRRSRRAPAEPRGESARATRPQRGRGALFWSRPSRPESSARQVGTPVWVSHTMV